MNAEDPEQAAHRTATRRWRAASLFAILVSLAWGLSACGGGPSASPGVAAVGSTTTPQLEQSRVPSEPSGSSRGPSSGSAVPRLGSTTTTEPGPSTTQPVSSQGAAGVEGSSSEPAKHSAQALEFAQCMRSHGVSDYADPPAPGRTPPAPAKVGMAYLGDSFNPNSPTFQVAERACQKYAVGLATKVSPGLAAEVAVEQLKYAQCMRAHGVPAFPDPSANGGFTVPNSVDQNSSFFQAAERTCQNFLPGVSGPPGG
jgi:hypothetical protein